MRYLIAIVLLLATALASADTTFTYQGQLQNGGQPFTGTPGMLFRLHDSPVDGNQIGDTEFFSGVPVEDGLFQVDLDFGEGAFDGSARYLEIEVAGDTLSPRQKITGSPWSLQSLSVAAGSVGSDQIAPGAVGSEELAENSITISPGAGLVGGGAVALGNATALGIAPGGVGSAELANEAITGNKLGSNIDISTSGTITANDLNADGELRVNANADDNLSYIRFRDSTASVGPRIFHRNSDNHLEFRGFSNVGVGGSFSANSVDAQTYLQDGQPFEPGAQPIIQTQMPDPADPGTVWMRLDEAGTPLWDHNRHTFFVMSVFMRNGMVYSGSLDFTVTASDAVDGSEVWTHDHHAAYVYSVFERNGVVYSGGDDDRAIAADASDGSFLWSHDHHADRLQSVFERNGVVYSGARDGAVIAADTNDNGTKLWEHGHHSTVVWSVFERNGVVYSGSSDNKVIAADATNGNILWTHEHHEAATLSVFERNGVVYSGSGTGGGRVIAANATDGSLLWMHSHHSGSVRSVFERNGVVYSASADATVIAADATDGSFIWNHDHHSGVVYSVFERNGVVYSGSIDNTVRAVIATPAMHVSDGNQWLLLSSMHPLD